MKKIYMKPHINLEVFYTAPLLAGSPDQIIIDNETDGDENLAKPVRGSRTMFFYDEPEEEE